MRCSLRFGAARGARCDGSRPGRRDRARACTTPPVAGLQRFAERDASRSLSIRCGCSTGRKCPVSSHTFSRAGNCITQCFLAIAEARVLRSDENHGWRTNLAEPVRLLDGELVTEECTRRMADECCIRRAGLHVAQAHAGRQGDAFRHEAVLGHVTARNDAAESSSAQCAAGTGRSGAPPRGGVCGGPWVGKRPVGRQAGEAAVTREQGPVRPGSVPRRIRAPDSFRPRVPRRCRIETTRRGGGSAAGDSRKAQPLTMS